MLALLGLMIVIVGWLLPAREVRINVTHNRLDGFRSWHDPGFALAAMNVGIEETKPGLCSVTTETRVYATDSASRRRFAAYWRTIYPGSALIRRMWLRAIKHRAESMQVAAKK